MMVVTFPRTKELFISFGIWHCSTTDGVREARVISWSRAERVLVVGTIDIRLRTPVETKCSGSPKGTFALSSQKYKAQLF